MAKLPDYYKVLGVAASADEKEIKAAYRKLSKQHHPDFGGDPKTFSAIAEAADVLLDETKRTDYDRERRRQAARASAGASSTSSYGPFEPPRREVPRVIVECPACGTKNRVIDSPVVVTAKCGKCGGAIKIERPEPDSLGKIFRDAMGDLASAVGNANVASILDKASDKLRDLNETMRKNLDEREAAKAPRPEPRDEAIEDDPLKRAHSKLDELDAWADRINKS